MNIEINFNNASISKAGQYDPKNRDYKIEVHMNLKMGDIEKKIVIGNIKDADIKVEGYNNSLERGVKYLVDNVTDEIKKNIGMAFEEKSN